MEGFRNEGFVEIAVVEYPGGDPSAASVLAEMAHVANRLAQQQRRPFKRVLVTRWIVPASQTGVHRIAGAEMLEADIPAVIADVLGHSKSKRIDTLVRSVVENSSDVSLGMASDVKEAFDRLASFMDERVYCNPYAKSEETKVPALIGALYEYLLKPDHLPPDLRAVAEEEGAERAACDDIAGMTDHYAVQLFETIFVPKAWKL